MSETYIIKIVKAWAEEEISKVEIASSLRLAEFTEAVVSAAGETHPVALHYVDDDGDRISLNTDSSLRVAFSEFQGKRKFKVVLSQVQVVTHDQMVTNVLEEYKDYLHDRSAYHFGYPYNLHYDHEEIFDCMKYSINNLGDPFVESNYGVHSRKFELDVLAFFADMWKIAEGDYWGYVTSCGTEGNLHSIICARENLPTAILYASEDSHYSIFKACTFYRMEYRRIRSNKNGEIDYAHLSEELAKNKGTPAIVCANIGTTVRGAVDSVDQIIGALKANDFKREDWYIHCDGALYALMLPFMKEFEQVNFQQDIDSMCVSGHKFLGCPMPCGVVICRKQNLEKISTEVEYLNSIDTTIMGSRNGHAPIFLWYSLQKGGKERLNQKVKMCHANARLLCSMLKDRGVEAELNERSTTVVLTRPPEPFVKHWQLACQGDIAHVVVMPNVTVEKIVMFVDEIESAFKGTWKPYQTESAKEQPDMVSPKTNSVAFGNISFKKSRSEKHAQRAAELNESFNVHPTHTKSPTSAPATEAA